MNTNPPNEAPATDAPPPPPQVTEEDLLKAVRAKDFHAAKDVLNKLLPKEEKPAVPMPTAPDKETKAFDEQNKHAETQRAYRAKAFKRPLPTVPEVPEANDYSTILGGK